jgi:hypothetical protein
MATVFYRISDTFLCSVIISPPKKNYDELFSQKKYVRGIGLRTLDLKKAAFSSQVPFFKKIHGVRNSDWFFEFRTPHMFLYMYSNKI